ncbi:NADH-quinone oxidoreductase subunit NuoN [Acidithiobacillus thiooxidans]|jgi:NADH-quinone oxidoreductase subunit N|uniref:NADH-quinone oxidoreductase subunit N n=1 Tax=Acidithiobacillus thiooxidans ATCC 19377 TaxID=637390 RepID=A0A543Q1K0_ACITH|nr:MULTISPECIES: NADH-quinone oxidoreductase subunit NuoN [Acidithiobacillus]MBU2810557.1 NADH-quinone oxidoreductase subunit NuoN [Acidithiobacillus thiooxidans]MBU2843172.1 NADH-quinone oxidoreductase subunit NuoN [Acidithiobacillus thiooxidans]MDA8175592.1 NADH-quinone oxidoreductase subunit NuoN [Acidithiobacillus sp.]MDD2751282.1 NADH-quinone oxidoreductase subunit NuoN [Acidithiobacillus sp.]MDR7925733.1 NADH-quinone oxidoreductase subunit NuoN [Acidithiobacillus thiooxidans]
MNAFLLHWTFAIPEIWVLIMACVVLLADLYLGERLRDVAPVLTVLTLLGAAVLTFFELGQSGTTFAGLLVLDPFTNVAELFSYLAVLMVVLYSRRYLMDRGIYRGEIYVLLLFALLGVMVMVSGANLLSIYLGLELLALSQYALVAFNRDSLVATEAGLKYFVLGALASGLLLYGMSLLYGLTGTLEVRHIAAALVNVTSSNLILVFALVFIVAGIAFKLGAAPFHMWLPDVYQGAPTVVTTFLASAPKIGAFALIIRLLVDGGYGMLESWQQIFIALTLVSLLVGNLIAIAQQNLKRMLAYSTVGHVGFLSLGIVAGTEAGFASAFFYTIVYVLMSLAGFGMILLLTRAGFEADRIDDFKGLSQRKPWYAFLMLIIMFSMAGVPPTVGFYAKLAVFQAVIAAGYVWLAVIGVLLAVIGAFYYLRVVKVMYFDAPEPESGPIVRDDLASATLSINSLALLVLGIVPGPLMAFCFYAMQGVI